MKRLGLLFLFTLSLTAQAQDNATPSPSPAAETRSTSMAPTFWLNAGPAFSTLAGDDEVVVSSLRTALMVEVAGEVPFTSMFSAQVGLDYIQKGQTLDVYTPDVAGSFILNYLELPVQAKVNLPVYKVGTVSFLAGPYVAMALSRSAIVGSVKSDASAGFKKFDFGARFGFEYSQPLTDQIYGSVGYNYDLGLININNSNSGDTLHTRSMNVAIGLGYKL